MILSEYIVIAASVIAWLIALLIAAPLCVLSIEIFAGLLPAKKRKIPPSDKSCAVLIPAHNEALGIAETLYDLKKLLPAHDRVIVVADNCSDETASIARACGAEVIERNDTNARGKGFALAFGRDYLAYEKSVPPDIVIVLDADCRLSPGSLEALISACALHPNAPAQAVNLIAPALDTSPMVQISGFAMVVKNLFRSRGMQRMGGPALLTGTGMAFAWPLFANADLATGSIVEDLGLGIALTRAGHSPRLIAEAQVLSAPAPADVALIQRTRWEHGFLDILKKFALSLIWSGITRISRNDLLLGLHLCVPPLALLLLISVVTIVLLSTLTLFGVAIAPMLVLLSVLTIALVAIFFAWIAAGHRWLSGTALLSVPFYILWKIPIYLKFISGAQTEWKRTPRDGE
jgi:cellulose synthase/poly-beta-1,6-N-acetylglucosamine synthase-like glycosyltransferase